MELYISKRCQHCRKLLILLQNQKNTLNNLKIICIDTDPFPKYIKKVPSMIVGNELWDNQKILTMLGQGPGQDLGQRQGSGPDIGQRQGPDIGQRQGPGPEPEQGQCGGGDDELLGYCESGECYYGLDDKPLDTYFEELDTPNGQQIDPNPPHESNKSKGLDRDYESLMEQRNMIK